jgi:hypothetical protein
MSTWGLAGSVQAAYRPPASRHLPAWCECCKASFCCCLPTMQLQLYAYASSSKHLNRSMLRTLKQAHCHMICVQGRLRTQPSGCSTYIKHQNVLERGPDLVDVASDACPAAIADTGCILLTASINDRSEGVSCWLRYGRFPCWEMGDGNALGCAGSQTASWMAGYGTDMHPHMRAAPTNPRHKRQAPTICCTPVA